MAPLKILTFMVLAMPLTLRAEELRLAFPVDCTLGQDCIIQNYVDLDPGPGWRDYNCGSLTYDGHKGTDIRVRDYQALAQGVSVYAAAGGVVLGVRNDMDDRRPDESYETYLDKIPGRECGNGVVILHEGDYQTQYCHLMKGSIVVAKGSRVETGDLLGTIGMSGKTQFPHLHISVRRGSTVVGPFTGPCSEEHDYRWKEKIEYTGTRLLKSGFSDKIQTLNSIEQGIRPRLTTDSDSLLFWANVVGIQAGDLQEVIITMPDGSILAEHRQSVAESKVNWLSYAGRKRPSGGWPKGRYTALYRLTRADRPIIDEHVVIELN